MRADLSKCAAEAWVLPIPNSHWSPGQIMSCALNMLSLHPCFLVSDDPYFLT